MTPKWLTRNLTEPSHDDRVLFMDLNLARPMLSPVNRLEREPSIGLDLCRWQWETQDPFGAHSPLSKPPPILIRLVPHTGAHQDDFIDVARYCCAKWLAIDGVQPKKYRLDVKWSAALVGWDDLPIHPVHHSPAGRIRRNKRYRSLLRVISPSPG